MHTPALQVSPGTHTLPQIPQLVGSVISVVQVPLQRFSPPGQVPPPPAGGAHAPNAQVSPPRQPFPQKPQLAGSVWMSVQTFPGQKTSGAAQVGDGAEQIPALHTLPGPHG